MKRIKILILFISIIIIIREGFTQTLESAKSIIQIQSNGDKLYLVECYFTDEIEDRPALEKSNKWIVNSSKQSFVITEFLETPSPKKIVLNGGWGNQDLLSVTLFNTINQTKEISNTDRGNLSSPNWGFGKGKAIDLSARRIAEQAAVYAFDYKGNIKIMEFYLPIKSQNFSTSKNFWLYSLNLDLDSKGTFAKDDEVQNGTQTSLQFSASPIVFVNNLIYNQDLSLGYTLETKMNSSQNNLFEIIHQSFKASARLEVPLTNYPFIKIHEKNEYLRVAMPLTAQFDYLSKGEVDSTGITTPSRFDFKLLYEMAFSPFLILKGEWGSTHFYDPPAGTVQNPTYYSLIIAQDLVATNSILGAFSFLLGSGEDLKDKYFIYFKLTQGERPPSFQNTNEKSFGLAMYF